VAVCAGVRRSETLWSEPFPLQSVCTSANWTYA
jgi:hypothetical protein